MSANLEPLCLAGLLGLEYEDVRSRLGVGGEHRVGGDRWLIYEGPGWRVRIRLGGRPGPSRKSDTVSSWVASLEPGFLSLRKATEPFGLWPDCAPDTPAPRWGLVRRALPPSGPAERTASFTATARSGRFVTLAGFDEAPEWPSGTA